MQRVLSMLAPLVLLVLLTRPTVAEPEVREVQWNSSLSKAAKTIRETKRPLLLYITVEGCSYCTLMKQQTYSDEGVISQIDESFIAAQIDGLKYRHVSEKIGVRIYPTTAIVAPDGKLIDMIHGFAPPEELLGRLRLAVRNNAAQLAQKTPVDPTQQQIQ